MKEDWKECIIGDICSKITSGGTPKSSNTSFYGGSIPWLNTKEVNFNRIYSTEKTISQVGYDNSSAKWIPKNSVIVAMYGATAGRVAISKIELTTNQACCNLIIDSNKADYNFIYYHLCNSYLHLSSLANGGAQQNLNANQIREYPINLPSLPTQQKIAAVLSSLDDKIELNNRINQNLEQQAQVIFKSWFVDFEPFGGKMPEGWRVGKLSEIADIIMGQSPDGKSYNEDGIGTVFYQGRAEFGTRFPTRRLFTTEPKRIAKKFDTLMSVRAPVGDLNIANEDCCIGRGLAAIHSKDNHQSFVHYTVVTLRPQLDVFNGEGTVFGCINRDALNNMKVIIPSKIDLDKFEKIVTTMDIDIFNRSEENDRLKNIRDTLLPKLMNGEIKL